MAIRSVPKELVAEANRRIAASTGSMRRPSRATLPQMSDERRVVTTADNEAEAELICGRLAEAGIHAVAQRAIGGPEWGASGSRYIYVAAGDYERAKAWLDAS